MSSLMTRRSAQRSGAAVLRIAAAEGGLHEGLNFEASDRFSKHGCEHMKCMCLPSSEPPCKIKSDYRTASTMLSNNIIIP
mmetsp:Transcript_11447/g.28203  ORF Transcript_11447/g.28203 Transcript_11447/m.28203 type:complete len:80 (+) Transcript_11447:777-1016(+)